MLSQVTSDSVLVDTNRYCFSEQELKIIIKTKIDLDACDSILNVKQSIIRIQENQKIELQNRIDALVEENKKNKKNANKMKWVIGGVSLAIGGLVIYSIVRK